jgi:hypothetical protein
MNSLHIKLLKFVFGSMTIQVLQWCTTLYKILRSNFKSYDPDLNFMILNWDLHS